MKSVWITRAEPGASLTAERLRALGYDPLIAPLLSIDNSESLDVDPADFQAVIITSANGLRALAALTDQRPKAYCVGDATAAAAQEAGFEAVSARGDADDLIALIRADIDPQAGPLLHAAGAHVSTNLSAKLATYGYGVTREALYYARRAEFPPDHLAKHLADRDIDAILFHSARAAAAYEALKSARSGFDPALIAISPRVAAALGGKVEIAETPDEAALLTALGRVLPPQV